ncbi:MAG: replication protein [candidate division WOR-3 bacterium]
MAYTKIENKILDKILASNFTKRQLKILLFIIRFSYGLGRKYAVLKKRDFSFTGVLPYHVEDELKKLIVRGVIKWNPRLGIFWINRNLKEWVDRNQKVDLFKG